MRHLLEKLPVFLTIAVLVAPGGAAASAAMPNVPYHTYNYDYWWNIYYTPAAYIPAGSISGEKLGCGSFSNPQDIFVDDVGRIYIADTGNNRIVILNREMQLERVIASFINGGKKDAFNSPCGLHVAANNMLYVADSGNLRVIALDESNTVARVIKDPTSEVLDPDFVFSPLKVTVDYAGRVYVIAKNMFQGIMAFDEKGDFTGFTGTIKVTISTYEKIWRILSTKSQRERQLQFIPTEFTGLDMAPDGFVYATNIDVEGTQSVRRLNPRGQDVIKKNARNYMGKGVISGDLYWGLSRDYGGASRIKDVVYRGGGVYSILDMTRGRIFTYDDEGNLLYIFGGMGSQEGTFRAPVAIEASGDRILVLDALRSEVMIFDATKYGDLINRAVSLRYDGDEASAVELWEKVLELDSNYELAYVGIGKSYLAAGNNKKAMEYFKLGMDREYYSIAYKRYRDDILEQNLGHILTGGIILAVALAARRLAIARKSKKRRGVARYED